MMMNWRMSLTKDVRLVPPFFYSKCYLEIKATKKVKLENMDLVEYYNYGYKNLIVSFDLTYVLCMKI